MEAENISLKIAPIYNEIIEKSNKLLEVKSIKGTGKEKCKCGAWINHWVEFSSSKSLPKICSVLDCNDKVEDGAHVIKCDSNDENQYIVPFCHQHNEIENKCFKLKPNAELVSANESDTCGK